MAQKRNVRVDKRRSQPKVFFPFAKVGRRHAIAVYELVRMQNLLKCSQRHLQHTRAILETMLVAAHRLHPVARVAQKSRDRHLANFADLIAV